jgi:transcriptional regulator with XRE-family HTH domain
MEPVNDLTEFARRLIQERKRRGFSQAALAKAVGVSLSSQKRYEKGERDPDTTYLAALARRGIDVAFLLTGEKSDDPNEQYRCIMHVIYSIQEFLDVAKGQVGRDFEAAAKEAAQAYKHVWSDPKKSEQADRVLWELLEKSPVLLPKAYQLADLVEKVEFVQDCQGLKLHAESKARLLLDLYREEKLSGAKADFASVERAIRNRST